MWLNALWAVPVAVFFWCRLCFRDRLWQISGASFGLVVAPASLGLYSLYFINPVVALLGILGLIINQFHAAPGYQLAIATGIVEPATVVRGISHVYINIPSGTVWSLTYGTVGYAIDRIRQRRNA